MAKKVTATAPLAGNTRSHALNATRHFQKPNLQKVTVNGKSVRMTAREIRTLNKVSRKAKETIEA
ncbi:MAG: 50S ribosomal protein L28 [Bacilli bacterium]|jgi:large subunit ribosomal protein L28|nr:50S ribosomal protein L28 [Bacilli bacterium]